jgi:hypothetical protein
MRRRTGAGYEARSGTAARARRSPAAVGRRHDARGGILPGDARSPRLPSDLRAGSGRTEGAGDAPSRAPARERGRHVVPFVSAPGRNRTGDSRFRNSMQPNSPSFANALNRAADQRVRSFEDHVVTRCFPVFRGTAAGPLRGRRAPLRARPSASWVWSQLAGSDDGPHRCCPRRACAERRTDSTHLASPAVEA